MDDIITLLIFIFIQTRHYSQVKVAYAFANHFVIIYATTSHFYHGAMGRRSHQ
jgi:hypothetical protein